MKTISVLFMSWILLLSLPFISHAAEEEVPQDVQQEGDMVTIKRGWFTMGSDLGELNERPEHEVYLNTYKIDRYEVSAKEFAEFLNAIGNPEDKYYTEDKYSIIISEKNRAGNKEYMPREGYEEFPANNISWYGADAYCRWKGKRLPTEAEWEKASRGVDGRLYPWGNILPDETRANYDKEWKETEYDSLRPISSYEEGKSPYGVYNMSGNAMEWTYDYYRQNYCDYCDPHSVDYINTASRLVNEREKPSGKKKAKGEGIQNFEDPEGPTVGHFKTLRGGSWYDSYGEIIIKSTYRFWLEPDDRYINTGFRCAK